MRRFVFSALASIAMAFAVSSPAAACPACQDFNTTASEENEWYRVARAYNRSIYMMLPVPYLLIGGVGLAYYRGYRRAYREAQARQQSR